MIDPKDGEDRFLAALGRHEDAFPSGGQTAKSEGAGGHLLAALDTMGEGFAVWDSEPNLISFNSRLPDLFGLARTDLHIGMHAKDFLRLLVTRSVLNIRAEEAQAWIDAYIDASTKADRKQEVRLADGAWLNFDWRRLPTGGFVAVFTDITLRKRAQTACGRPRPSTARFSTMSMRASSRRRRRAGCCRSTRPAPRFSVSIRRKRCWPP